MIKVPCKCSGYRLDKCKCKVLSNGYRCEEPDGVVYLAHSNNCMVLDLKDRDTSNIFINAFQSFYDVCAGYNLRYCTIDGFQKRNNNLGDSLKDLVILTCFLIANFVVFLTIFTKLLVHIFYVLTMVVQWIRDKRQCYSSTRSRSHSSTSLWPVWESKINKSNAATFTGYRDRSKTKHLTFKCPITKIYPDEEVYICPTCCTNKYSSRNFSPPLKREMFTHNYSPPI